MLRRRQEPLDRPALGPRLAAPRSDAPEGTAARSPPCRVPGAGLDPQRRVHAERRAHHGQLVAGGRAAAEGA